jgi:prepilin-type N-terminal cleavage/methylation domain-containing protein
MTLKNIKQQGFTIVELLIVIVVIAILAAITIVAYNGVQNRAKATSGQELAAQVAKKAELFNTVKSTYPTFGELTAASSTVKEAQLDNTSAVLDSGTAQAVTATSADGGKAVGYKLNADATKGACVYYWDYSAASGSELKTVKAGAGC